MQRATENGSPITILIAETCRMGCQLLATVLQRSRHRFSVVACAVDSPEILNALKNTEPDVCIISAHLKDGPSSGFRVTRELRASHRKVRVILVLDSFERAVVVEAFRSGARGVFCRDEPFEVLCRSIQRVYEGQVWASNKQLQYLVESLAESAPPYITDSRGASLLTKRELSLVYLVAEGRTNRDISRELNLSEHTVRNYLFRIFNKVGTSNRLELALYAVNQRRALEDRRE